MHNNSIKNILSINKCLNNIFLVFNLPFKFFQSFQLFQYCISNELTNIIISSSKAYPVDTERKLNVHETFRRCPGYLIYVQFTYSVYGVKAIFKKDSVLVKLGVIHYTIFVFLKVFFMEELLLFHNFKIHLI